MTPRPLLVAFAVLVPHFALAQGAAGQKPADTAEPRGKAISISGKTMCGIEMSADEFQPIDYLARCLTHCPTPNGYESCRTGVMGFTDLTPDMTGGAWHESLACNVYRGSAAQLSRHAAETDGGKWGGMGNCTGEFGAAAEVLFGRAKSDKTLYPAALAIMRKASVKGKRFAPLLYQALGADGPTDPRLRALALDLLRRNFINASKPEDRVIPKDSDLLPLMYDADPTVSAMAVKAMADKIHQSETAGNPRFDRAFALLAPVVGNNDALNPLPAGVNPPTQAARKAAIDGIREALTVSDKSRRERVFKHLLRLGCEGVEEVRKAAFDLQTDILQQVPALREMVPNPKGGKIRKDHLLRDQLYDALFASGDMGSSPAAKNNPASAQYAENCIGPVPVGSN